jgi:hypothetical protein
VRVVSLAVAAIVLAAGCAPTPEATAPPTAPAPGRPSASPGWEITVYYTAVEEYHDGTPRRVTGCRVLDCAYGNDDLGGYPADFVTAVRDEGTGRITAGGYLNWSYDVGYWLDSAPRGSAGAALRPYVSAAADPGVLAPGTRFRITDCGRQDDGSRLPAAACETLRGAGWRVEDEFTPGLGGARHLDVYIGPETGPDFTESDLYVTLTGATLRIG